MKRALSLLTVSLLQISICYSQASKEEAFMRAFFEVVQKSDKKALVDKFCLKESDVDVYNESQKKIGSTKVISKEEFAKFVDEKNKKIIRDFEELLKHAVTSKIDFEYTSFASYKRILAANAEIPSSYYIITFNYHDLYTFKMKLECCPLGDDIKLFNVIHKLTM